MFHALLGEDAATNDVDFPIVEYIHGVLPMVCKGFTTLPLYRSANSFQHKNYTYIILQAQTPENLSPKDYEIWELAWTTRVKSSIDTSYNMMVARIILRS
jgi:hypothetical protein